MSAALQCDTCGFSQPEDGAVGWVHTEARGIDTRMLGDRPLQGDFCSRRCLIERFEGDRQLPQDSRGAVGVNR